MGKSVVKVSARRFKAKCLTLIRALERGKMRRVIITKPAKPVAELHPSQPRASTLWGVHRGSVQIAQAGDLIEPVVDEALDAERGVLLR